MKKFLGFLFLLIIFINTIGHYALLVLARQHITTQILHKIDENVNEVSGNMILRVPINLPYSDDSPEYKRVNGEIAYDGEVYRMVKQRIYNDTLYIVCLRDNKTTAVNQAISEHFQNLNGQETKSESRLKLFRAFNEYIFTSFYTKSPAIESVTEEAKTHFADLYAYTHSEAVFQPPKFATSLLVV